MKRAAFVFFMFFIGFYVNAQIIEIKEKMFIAQTDDIYLNSKDYLGKTIKFEGIFIIDNFSSQESPIYGVFRYSPGCCGYDGMAGFGVLWDTNNKSRATYPKHNDWVEVIGILKENSDGEIYIALTKLTVLDKRGAEFVRQ